MGVAVILVMWPFEQHFVPAYYAVSIWNLILIGTVVSEEKMWADGHQSDWYTISSPMSLRLTWANKDDSYFLKNTRLSFDMGPVSP